ncbi:hypothetical protein MG293_001610 [Ovis ammon polii]|uniref:Uncharacterized protein n=1 Tax=Ovis ammon polii TaxID=230172 RepID=A0AAD4YFT8_OVIAM|nr:hypothetical protein MG293_001610 [Ovis ammon polii]
MVTQWFPGKPAAVVPTEVAETGEASEEVGTVTLPIRKGEGNGKPLWYSCLENLMDRVIMLVRGAVIEALTGTDRPTSQMTHLHREALHIAKYIVIPTQLSFSFTWSVENQEPIAAIASVKQSLRWGYLCDEDFWIERRFAFDYISLNTGPDDAALKSRKYTALILGTIKPKHHNISTVPRILAAPPDGQGLTFLAAAIVVCASADKHQKILQLRREVELLPGQQIY